MRLSRRIQLIFCLCAAASVSLAPPPARAADAPDLGMRKHGVDWPQFLGPTGDSKSPEKGIVTDWPAAGPKILWYTKLGEGYCMPSISKGRLFAFDRIGREDRLRCLESETGKQLWEFRYPTDYVDIIGYDKGPRAQPLVDGDRLYILGPQGMLLEELLVRHALAMPGADLDREDNASGVMMIPVPKSGVLEKVEGEEQARSTPGIEDVKITARLHDFIAAWPEGSSYLGFLFARGKSPEEVEAALRQAHQQLKFELSERLPVANPVTGAVPSTQ